MRILVADDDLMSQQLLAAILEEAGHDVVIANDGAEAWSLLETDPVRMVITDWEMPELDGLELCRRIRSQKSGKYTYAILLTANRDQEHVAAGLEAGADDFVTKPFDPVELSWRIQAGNRMLQLEDELAGRIEDLDRATIRLQAANDQIRAELDAAANAQRALLPRKSPDNPHMKCGWVFRPCDQLGGDGLNVFPIDDRYIGVYLADVCGHGVSSALLAVTIHRVLTPTPGEPSLLVDQVGNCPTVVGPETVLQRVNKRFPMDLDTGQYFTLLYGVLDTQDGSFRYASAGHPPPILLRKSGEVQHLDGSGFPIGIVDSADYCDEIAHLEPGDRLCIFSDGMIEAKDDHGTQFGRPRLADELVSAAETELDEILLRTISRLESWVGDVGVDDDISGILLEFTGEPSAAADPVADESLAEARS